MPICLDCGYEGMGLDDIGSMCPECHSSLRCPNEKDCLGGDSDDHGDIGRHYAHVGRPCSWHDGPCETAVFCACNEGESDDRVPSWR